MVIRISLLSKGEKADGVQLYGRQQSPKRYGDVEGTPPGSESVACIERGSSETWENPQSPCEITLEVEGYRDTKSPGIAASSQLRKSLEKATERRAMTRYWEASESEATRKGHVGSLSGA